MSGGLRVVFDINIWIAAFLGPDSSYPLILRLSPTTTNASADCVSLAFDGDHFSVFASPHILKNVYRVLVEAGVSQASGKDALSDISDIVHFSLGQILQPERKALYQGDFEDNVILDLALATDAQLIVTLDSKFRESSGYKGIAVMHPRDFCSRIMSQRG